MIRGLIASGVGRGVNSLRGDAFISERNLSRGPSPPSLDTLRPPSPTRNRRNLALPSSRTSHAALLALLASGLSLRAQEGEEPLPARL